jgi:hypothetical protein
LDASLYTLVDLVLPPEVKTYFRLTSHKSDEESLHLYLEELNNIPEEYLGQQLESKGFYEESTLQDFPIRGRNVFLHVKRRRWMNHSTGKVVQRNWKLVAKGTRITKDFAAFLKEVSRYTGS